MKGITLTVSETNGKIIFDWGFKGMSNLDISNIPNTFGIRDYLASKLGKQSIFARLKNGLGKGFNSVLGFMFSKKIQSNNTVKTQETTNQNTSNKDTKLENIPFYDFTKDDLGIHKEAEKTTTVNEQISLPGVTEKQNNTQMFDSSQFTRKPLQVA